MERFCIQCGRPFEAAVGDESSCPDCGGGAVPIDEELMSDGYVLIDSPPPQIPAPTSSGRSFTSEDSVPPDLLPGDVLLDLYQVTGLLGEGGMGRVYRVHHRTWGLDLAMKSPKPGVDGFAAEAEAWVNLGLHPHIVTCHYVRRLGGIPRVFAELVDGGSLKEWIEEGRLYAGNEAETLERLLDVAIQFAWGLGYSHERGLVHQDVKPGNVLLDGNGVVKVTDFGLIDRVGYTPAYVSPEQADAAEQRASPDVLTGATDVWSWALSVLDMFSGEARPDRFGQAAAGALRRYVERGPEEDGLPAMPNSLIDLLGECFRTDPDKRPHGFDEIMERLVDVYEQANLERYPRDRPEAAELLADQLNNKALSLLDLEREEEAERLFDEALEADPHHLEATYNQGLRRWRSGEITDLDLVTQLEQVGLSHAGDWHDEYLLALVHIERGDAESAARLLRAAQEQAADIPEVEAALANARAGAASWCDLLGTWEGHARHREVAPAAAGDNGPVPSDLPFLPIDELPVGAEIEVPDGRWVVSGYDGDVEAVAVSPGGQWVASGSSDRTVRIWTAESGQCVGALHGHQDSVHAVAVTPDGRFVVSGSGDNTVRVWDPESGVCVRTLTNDNVGVWSVSVAADGRSLVSGGEDKTVRLWDLHSGECVKILQGHTDWINAVAVSPDGHWAISGSADETVRLWDMKSGDCTRTLFGHTGWVWSVAVSPDGRWAVSGSADGTVRLWDVSSGDCVRTLRGHTAMAVAISPDGRWVISGGDRTVRLWDVQSGRCVRTLEGHTEPVLAVATSPDGRWIVSGSKDETVRLWRLGLGGSAPFAHAHPSPSSEVLLRDAEARAALDDAHRFLTQGRPKKAFLSVTRARQLPGYERHPDLLEMVNRTGRSGRRLAVGQAWCRQTLEGHTDRVCAVAVSPDGRWVISGGDETVRVWDVMSGQCKQTLVGETRGVTVRSVAVSPDGRWVAAGMGDKTVRIWDLRSGQFVQQLIGHDHWVSSVAISRDGTRVVSGSGDETVRLWDVESWQCLRTLRGQTSSGPINAVAISPDGRWIVAASEEETFGPLGESYLYQVRVFDVASGRTVNTLQGHSEGVRAVAASPAGRWIGTAGVDGTVKIWHTAECNPPVGPGTASTLPKPRTLQAHSDWVSSLAVSPDGRWVASGSGDKTVRLWDVSSGDCVAALQGHTSYVDDVAFSPDGRWVVSGSGDGTARIWELDWEYEFPDPADWDEGAQAYLEIFLTLHTPYGPDGVSREGSPTWSEEKLQQLLTELGRRGYGWLRPDGVRGMLEKLAVGRGWNPPG